MYYIFKTNKCDENFIIYSENDGYWNAFDDLFAERKKNYDEVRLQHQAGLKGKFSSGTEF